MVLGFRGYDVALKVPGFWGLGVQGFRAYHHAEVLRPAAAEFRAPDNPIHLNKGIDLKLYGS